MNMQCPQCGSPEFTKLSLVYAHGFSEAESQSRFWGFSFGEPAFGYGRAKTRGHLQK